VLLTGARGAIGRATSARLARDGWHVQEFDLVDGDDLLDPLAVRSAAGGCHAIVHAGAIPHDSRGAPAEITATNVLGTWHVLLAAERVPVERVVVFSSVQVFGCSDGEFPPLRYPIDDDHPRRAGRAYGSSKRLAEDLCEQWSLRTGIPTVALRPVATFGDVQFPHVNPARLDHGAFVHVDDVADAVALALCAPLHLHERLLLTAAGGYDAGRARERLGWTPVHDRPPRRRLRHYLRG
jgi:nucleoside-diphosphate-sugar epimerase